MTARRLRVLVASLVGTLCLALPAVLGAPAQAAPQDLALAMSEGQLRLRDSEEPADLGSPTTLVGSVDDATGVLTGTLSVAPLSFSFDITSPIFTTVYVDATFSELTPGSTLGAVTKQGDVTVSTKVKVDLHVEVGNPAILTADCLASPVTLGLTSTAPADEVTGRVTLVDEDFSVPAVPTNAACSSIIASGVNERLAGAGHAMTLVMEGELPRPLVGEAPTTTTLEVDPASSREGTDVTLTAQVAASEPGEVAPVGLVEFRDGATVLGSEGVDDDGTATLVTSALPVGTRQLTAAFRGDDLHAPSASEAVAHEVVPWPTVTVTAPATAAIGGSAMATTLTVANPGAAIENARLHVEVARTVGTAVFVPARITGQWLDGDTWQDLALTTTGTRVVGAPIGADTGFALPAGASRSVKVRFTFPDVGGTVSPTACAAANPTCPGTFRVSGRAVEVDPTDGTVVGDLAQGEKPFSVVEAKRRVTTLTIPGNNLRVHTVRSGYSIEAAATPGPAFAGNIASGFAELYVDGQLLPVRSQITPFEDGFLDRLPLASNGLAQLQAILPPDIAPGTHFATVRYLGDRFFAPAETTFPFTVLPSAGEAAACLQDGFTAKHSWGANLVVDGSVPATAVSGSVVDVALETVQVLGPRPTALASDPWYAFDNGATVPVGTNPLRGVAIGLGPDGEGTASAVHRTGAVVMPATPNPADPSLVDQTVTLVEPTGTVVVTGAPGDLVPVQFTHFDVDFTLGAAGTGIPLHASCSPLDGPLTLGEVEIAGTVLSVDPEGPVREKTDEVELEAATYPAAAEGTVTFHSDLDGELGTGTVTDGAASLVTDELTPGTHQITASFDATDPDVPDTTSEPVALQVTYSPRSGTEAFVVAARTDFLGSASGPDVAADAATLAGGTSKASYLNDLTRSEAWLTQVVNGMYQDLLGRPGDPSGVGFWVRKLQGGSSVAQVAGAFYSSSEYFNSAGGGAVETWIEDLYVKLLGRPADASGRSYWAGQVNAKGRTSVATRFFQSSESARARVVALYEELLGRTPSASEAAPWAARVIARGDLYLATSLAASPEYANRAEVRYPLV